MKNISIEMLIFFCGTIIATENGGKPKPPIMIVPLTPLFEKKPGSHPLRIVQYRADVIRDIEEEDVETDIEGETPIEEPQREKKRESWLKWCCRCISGRDDND